jgi:hypothetical protein
MNNHLAWTKWASLSIKIKVNIKGIKQYCTRSSGGNNQSEVKHFDAYSSMYNTFLTELPAS